jgi:uncharacterized protein (TIRG00374 family)
VTPEHRPASGQYLPGTGHPPLGTAGEPSARPRSSRAWRRAWRYARYAIGLGLAGLIVYVLLGKTGELSDASRYLADARLPLLPFAVLLELGAVVSFAGLQRRLLLSGDVPVGMTPLTAITLAGNSINNSLPGGTAFASLYAFRQYILRRADETLAAWTVLAVAVFAGVSLALVSAAGLVVSGAEGGLDLIGDTLLTLVAAIVVGGAAALLLWHLGLLVGIFSWVLKVVQRVAPALEGDPQDLARRIVGRLRVVRPRGTAIASALAWAMGNWVLDCGCLAVSFVAVGAPVPWRSLLLAYCAGQLAANLPVTPGGLGVVEGSITIAVVAYGGGEASTVAAVLLYRLINFWGSLPVGWAAFGGLALEERARRRRVHAARGATT